MRIVLDTNVLVSGLLNASGVPGQILDMVISGPIELIIDDRIFFEYRRVLLHKKLPIEPDEARDLLDFIEHSATWVPANPLSVRLPDPDDEMFVEVARSGKAVALVTGNLRHFPGVPEVMLPGKFLERLRRGKPGIW